MVISFSAVILFIAAAVACGGIPPDDGADPFPLCNDGGDDDSDQREMAKSIRDLKQELASLGITDTSDCLERSDLEAKLELARAQKHQQQPQTQPAKRYGRTIEVGHKQQGAIKGLVILSHGLGDTAVGWEDSAQHWASKHKDLLFILPTAPTQPVSLNGGMEMPSWYDIKGLGFNVPEDAKGIFESAHYLVSIAVRAAEQYKIPTDSIVFAGFSQGAVVSLAAGLICKEFVPRGVIMMSGYLGARERLGSEAVNHGMPILMCHGSADPLIPLTLSHATRDALKMQIGCTNISYKEYPGMMHGACMQEINDVSSWLTSVGL